MSVRLNRKEAKALERLTGMPDGSLAHAKRKRATGGTPEPLETLPIFPYGVVILSGIVLGRAVPWKVPTINARTGRPNLSGGRGRDYRRLKKWQDFVRSHGSGPPYPGLVALDIVFYMSKPRMGQEPDRTNLLKAFEDGLQWDAVTRCGFILNDRSVKYGCTSVEPVEPGRDRVEFVIWSLGEYRNQYERESLPK